MRDMARFLIAAFVMPLLWLSFIGSSYAENVIHAIRIGGDETKTRFVLEMPNEPAYSFRAESEPYRLILKLEGADWNFDEGVGAGNGLVSGYTYLGRFEDVVLLELALSRPFKIDRHFTLPPVESKPFSRLVLDFKPASKKQFIKTIATPVTKPAATKTQPVATELDEVETVAPPTEVVRIKKTIVIDPGHGGKDPGAHSAKKVHEKNVNLSVARELKYFLDKTGDYNVLLTRENDKFIELVDRVGFARDKGADLFISLHADAAGKSSTRGASVYTLSQKGERRSFNEKHKHNWVMDFEEEERPEDVQSILRDLVNRETRNRSAEFADILISKMADTGPVLRNSHRDANFYVLLAPDVPAVLLELGFMTNAEDARILSSRSGQRKKAKAIADAINVYFDRQNRLIAESAM